MHAMPGHGEGMHALEHSVEHQGIDIPTTAPDESTIREHARRAGFPANRISAVRELIDPTTGE